MGYKRQRTGAKRYGGTARYNNVGGTSYKAKRYRGGGGGGFRTGGFRGTEVKFLDTAIHEVTILNRTWAQTKNFNPAVQGCLFAPATGTGPSERVGRTVVLKRITIKGHVSTRKELPLDANTAPGSTRFRIIVVHDSQNNGSTPDLDIVDQGVLTNLDSLGTTVDNDNAISSFTDLEHTRRFKILADRTITINPMNPLSGGASGIIGPSSREFVIDKALNMPVMMAAAGTSISGIEDNSIYVYCLAENRTVTDIVTNVGTLSYVCRARFTDA